MNKKILHLPVRSKWYLMEELGIKTEEYREINDYWCKRLMEDPLQVIYPFCDITQVNPNIRFKHFDGVRMRYGYTRRFMDFGKPTIKIGRGNPEWGAPQHRDVFIINLKK